MYCSEGSKVRNSISIHAIRILFRATLCFLLFFAGSIFCWRLLIFRVSIIVYFFILWYPSHLFYPTTLILSPIYSFHSSHPFYHSHLYSYPFFNTIFLGPLSVPLNRIAPQSNIGFCRFFSNFFFKLCDDVTMQPWQPLVIEYNFFTSIILLLLWEATSIPNFKFLT